MFERLGRLGFNPFKLSEVKQAQKDSKILESLSAFHMRAERHFGSQVFRCGLLVLKKFINAYVTPARRSKGHKHLQDTFYLFIFGPVRLSIFQAPNTTTTVSC